MMGLFSRRKRTADAGGLGTTLIALRLEAGDIVPTGGTLVVFNAAGHARRAAASKVACEEGEVAFCFHPGPYTVDLMPFAAAPEWGLRLRFVIDAANPRIAQQRFDLYLYSETAGRLELADFASAVEIAVQGELAQGALELPPCTTLEEWHAFRAGLNQLMYTRYGVTVDDCVPVDLGEQIDYATMLQARIAAEATRQPAPAVPPAAAPTSAADTPSAPPIAADEALPRRTSAAAGDAAQQDARALRRLFLELPVLSSELRQLTLPEGLPIFQQHQALLQRLGMAALNVNTMPSLAWATPDQALAPTDQARRTVHTLIAQAALDETWSLLARLQLAGPQQWPPLLDEADRICANLEAGLTLRRQPNPPRTEPSL